LKQPTPGEKWKDIQLIDTKREACLRLMTEIEALEEQVEIFEQESEFDRHSAEPQEAAVARDQLTTIKMSLAQKRGELERLSDGCAKPHLW
jgi:hypothetical protein